MTRIWTPLTLILGSALLVGCGGGGGGTTQQSVTPTPVAPSPPPSTSSENTWTQGQFAAASSFKSLCEAPRSGVDANGDTFDDRSGTLSDELFWLRSWSDETYLWYDEITDQNPNNSRRMPLPSPVIPSTSFISHMIRRNGYKFARPAQAPATAPNLRSFNLRRRVTSVSPMSSRDRPPLWPDLREEQKS
jgi:hypothetical protein